MTVILYTMLSVVVVSLISIIGIFSFFGTKKIEKHHLLLMVSLSAGTLFGGAFLHLLPEAVEEHGFGIDISLLLLAGVVVFFLLEKFIHWRHCHDHPEGKMHKVNSMAPLNLLGDAFHNLLDGLIIAGSYFVSVPAGIATTVAVILHEVPQEIADFGVLLYSGVSRKKALFLNFLSASVAIVGAIIGIWWGAHSELFIRLILPFAAGGFLYIAGSNLIPELHKECGLKDSFGHFIALLVGIALMFALKFLE